MVEIWLPYGSSEIPVRVPEERLLEILNPNKLGGTLDASAELNRLMESDSDLLNSAGKARGICIAVGPSSNRDLTAYIIKILIEKLIAVGAAAEFHHNTPNHGCTST